MKKKLLYILITILIFFFISCNNDNDVSDTQLFLPKTIIYKDQNNKIYQTKTFTYDDNKIVSFSNGNVFLEFIYEGNQIVKEIQYRDYGESYSEKSYSYSNNDLKTVRILANGKETKYVYIDNGDGTITKERYDFDQTGKESKSKAKELLIFENGNLIKSVSDWENEPYITTCRYYYDLKNNAFKNISGLNLLLDQANFGSEESFSSTNNVNKYLASTNYESRIGSDPYKEIIFEPYAGISNYEYNKKGYPTKKSTSDYSGKVVETIEYTY